MLFITLPPPPSNLKNLTTFLSLFFAYEFRPDRTKFGQSRYPSDLHVPIHPSPSVRDEFEILLSLIGTCSDLSLPPRRLSFHLFYRLVRFGGDDAAAATVEKLPSRRRRVGRYRRLATQPPHFTRVRKTHSVGHPTSRMIQLRDMFHFSKVY